MTELNEEVDGYEIKMEEMGYAIKWKKKGKATGQDSIAAEMLKALVQNGKTKLLKIINRVLGLMNC